VSYGSMPSRAAVGGMHRKAEEEEPIAELWATTTNAARPHPPPHPPSRWTRSRLDDL
jgi:hypothetical protein